MIAVLAGNNEEYTNWQREQTDLETIYINDKQAIEGRQFDSWIEIGTFWSRGDAEELFDAVTSRISRS